MDSIYRVRVLFYISWLMMIKEKKICIEYVKWCFNNNVGEKE